MLLKHKLNTRKLIRNFYVNSVQLKNNISKVIYSNLLINTRKKRNKIRKGRNYTLKIQDFDLNKLK